MSTKLTDEEIRDALFLCEQATPGPWVSGKMFVLHAVNLSRETKGRSIKTGMCVACVPGYGWDTTPIREFEEGKNLWHIHQQDTYDGHHSIYSSSECAQVAGNYDDEDGGIVNQSDSEFIAAARDLLPRALAEIKSMREHGALAALTDQESRYMERMERFAKAREKEREGAQKKIQALQEGAKRAEDLLRDAAYLLGHLELRIQSEGWAHDSSLLRNKIEGLLRGGV